jgi:hypothetical protein
MKMEAVAMVRRGWPNDGAVERAELIKASTTLVNGDWVSKQTDGTVAKTLTVNLSAGAPAGLVMVGNGDSASSLNTNKAVVLWSGFIVDVSNYDAVPTYAPGSPLTIKTANPGVLTLGVQGTDPIVAVVLDVIAVSTTETAHLTVLVK